MSTRAPVPHYPRTVSQFLAYQLARRLADFENIGSYLRLAAGGNIAFLITAYHQARDAGETVTQRQRIFWEIIGRSEVR